MGEFPRLTPAFFKTRLFLATSSGIVCYMINHLSLKICAEKGKEKKKKNHRLSQ